MMEIGILLMVITAAALIDAWRDTPERIFNRRARRLGVKVRWEHLPALPILMVRRQNRPGELATWRHVKGPVVDVPMRARTCNTIVRYPMSISYMGGV